MPLLLVKDVSLILPLLKSNWPLTPFFFCVSINKNMEKKSSKRPFGVFVGRFCPVHLGHEVIIREMLRVCGPKNSLLVVGSSNAPMSLRHFFSYKERRNFIARIFPDIRIVGLPDYFCDEDWMLALDDLINVWLPKKNKVTFFGGCEEDVRFFFDFKRKCRILNRFDGSSPKLSATEVRDALIHGRSMRGLLNPIIEKEVTEVFSQKWEKFRKM